MPIYKINFRDKTSEVKSGIRKLKVFIKKITCGLCNTNTFKMTGKYQIGKFGKGKIHILKCSTCNGKISIEEGTLD